MANATKATTALVAVALGLASVTAAFVTISSTASVAEMPAAKIQDRLASEVRLISIDDATAGETIVVRSNAAAETIAIRMVPLPTRAPRAAQLPASSPAVKSDLQSSFASAVPLPQPKPIEVAALDAASVPLPLPRPDPEMIVGSLTTDEAMTTR